MESLISEQPDPPQTDAYTAPNRPERLRHVSEPPASPKKMPKRNLPTSAGEVSIASSVAPRLEGKTTELTDTRSVPASPGSVEKRNHQSDAYQRGDAAKPGKLRFSENESTINTAKPDKPPPIAGNKRLAKIQRKAGRSAEKLAAAERKLPQKRRPKIRRAADEKSGKPKRRPVFEGEVKSRRAHMAGPLITRPVKIGINNVIAFGHRKIYQAEHENVGLQAAHKAEILAESGLRGFLRLWKSAPYRRVEKLGRRTAKLNAKVSYQKAFSDNPKLRSNLFSRMAQKRRIKKKYAKAAREAKKTGTRIKNAANVTEKTVTATARFVARHPLLFLIIGLLALLVAMIAGLFTSCSDMASGISAAVAGTSYLAEDVDINDAELYYTEWETDLRLQINSAENDYPGYDEHRYQLGAIGHDPYELMAYLTAVYQDFTYPGVEAALRELFREQYQLTFTPSVETRYRDPNDRNADGDYEPYDWHILTVTLNSKPFADVIALSDEQKLQYEALLQSKGNRQYAGSPLAFDWLPNISSYYGYRVHPISGAKDCHMGIDIAIPVGTDILAAHNGVVSVGNDPGGYGIYVTLTGENGLVTKYGHLDSVVAEDGQSVSFGDVIAKSGNTGSSTGPHLHFEVLKDGVYLNPAYFSAVNGTYIPINQ
ncbi:MAG: M23 family metallopeptidase [Oscillospiraceae bacterium]|jgi:murein DD-endopeptidase MepM/ murein hydrolase activator NlpD|nr:M23 family metallopeptidase [Oscillospiraceae bacterium]